MTPLLELARSGPRSNLAGVGLMLAGAFLFSVNDALGKWLLADYSVGRSVAAVVEPP